jgi:hypothetical protein
MRHIVDLIHIIAPDRTAFERERSRYLANGWQTYGPVKLMRPLHDYSTTVLVQLVVRWSS